MRVVIVALLALSSALPEVKTRLKKDAHRVGRGPKFGYSADDGVVASLRRGGVAPRPGRS